MKLGLPRQGAFSVVRGDPIQLRPPRSGSASSNVLMILLTAFQREKRGAAGGGSSTFAGVAERCYVFLIMQGNGGCGVQNAGPR